MLYFYSEYYVVRKVEEVQVGEKMKPVGFLPLRYCEEQTVRQELVVVVVDYSVYLYKALEILAYHP